VTNSIIFRTKPKRAFRPDCEKSDFSIGLTVPGLFCIVAYLTGKRTVPSVSGRNGQLVIFAARLHYLHQTSFSKTALWLMPSSMYKAFFTERYKKEI